MKYSFLLCVVLFSGHHSTYAKTLLKSETSSLSQIQTTSKSSDFNALQFFQYLNIPHFNTSVEKDNHNVGINDSEETEEEDFKFIKKKYKACNCISTDLYTQKSSCLFHNTHKCSPINERYFYIPSNRLHIIFLVFRI